MVVPRLADESGRREVIEEEMAKEEKPVVCLSREEQFRE